MDSMNRETSFHSSDTLVVVDRSRSRRRLIIVGAIAALALFVVGLAAIMGRSSGDKSASAVSRAQTWLDIGLGAQILRDLNVHSIRLITSSNRHYVGLSGFGIEIAETLKLGE